MPMLSRRSFLAMPSAAPLGLGHAPAVDSCPQFFSPLPVTASAPPLIASATPSATVSALPRLGLGTCCDEPEEAREQVLGALDAGYRLIDTAAHYPSEMAVGDAIATAFESGTLRSKEDLTVCTKIWFDEMGYEPALASIQRSLHRLRLDQLGVLLIHFPGAPDAVQDPKRNRRLREDTWRACERALEEGLTRRIGVSNWSPRHLRETLASCRLPPQILQTEIHPRLQQRTLREDCVRANIHVMAHCPLAHGSRSLLLEPTLKRIGADKGLTAAQVALRWSVQSGMTPVPRGGTAERIRENLGALDFTLSAEEMRAVDALDADDRVSFDPKVIA